MLFTKETPKTRIWKVESKWIENANRKKAAVSIQISNKILFKTKNIYEGKTRVSTS